MKQIIPTLFIFATLLASCSTHKMTRFSRIKATSLDKKKIYAIPLDATVKQNLVWRDASNNVHVLTEVSPDAVVTAVTNVTAKLAANLSSGDSFTADQATTITQNLTQLGQRTVAVSILRDALYRLEEYNLNIGSNPLDTSTYKLFNKILDAATTIALADMERAEAENATAQSKAADAETRKIVAQEVIYNTVASSPNNLQAATTYENAGFQALLDSNFEQALESFEKAEEAYPTLRSVYEIRNRLRSVDKSELDASKKLNSNVISYIVNECQVPYKVRKALKEKYKLE